MKDLSPDLSAHSISLRITGRVVISGPTRGFGYAVSGAVLILVYGFLSQFEYKVSTVSLF